MTENTEEKAKDHFRSCGLLREVTKWGRGSGKLGGMSHLPAGSVQLLQAVQSGQSWILQEAMKPYFLMIF